MPRQSSNWLNLKFSVKDDFTFVCSSGSWKVVQFRLLFAVETCALVCLFLFPSVFLSKLFHQRSNFAVLRRYKRRNYLTVNSNVACD